jgi:predicted RNase H-like HicB family nuclease
MKRAFSARTWTEGEWVIAQCVEVDVASHGHTEEEAVRNLKEALELSLDTPTGTDPITVNVRPRRRRYKMSELMAGFKPEHRHGEWDLGGPVGKEIW